MLRSREYSLDELLDHPVLSLEMARQGLDPRCFELIFEAACRHHRFAEAEYSAGGDGFGSASTSPRPM